MSRPASLSLARPSSLSTTAILEDGTQQVSIQQPLGQGFTFGSNPAPPQSLTRTRRGHHHKHSRSHNFFSFLEPGSVISPSVASHSPKSDSSDPELHTQPVPVPIPSWHENPSRSPVPASPLISSPTLAKFLSFTNLCLGATLWVRGQQRGSLACTGLGYWVVFDAIGLTLSHLSPTHKASADTTKRPYGPARVQSLFTFAQSVYLMFSAVYVCKETVELVLLSAGEFQAHPHHSAGGDILGPDFELPIILTLMTFFSLLVSAFMFDNNSALVDITQTRISSLPIVPRILRSFLSRSASTNNHTILLPHQTRITNAFDNPFILSPLLFCTGIFVNSLFVLPSYQRPSDLLIASAIAFITFNLAYRSCVVYGTVLLQTGPPRTAVDKGRVKLGRKEGQMEAFLRTMREVERHPYVLHLPAPHIWQIAPKSCGVTSASSSLSNLVVTLELHVDADLGDEDVLELTHWAWERVVIGLGGSLTKSKKENGVDEPVGPEVTVGIVRG